jgi:hypothetical protein
MEEQEEEEKKKMEEEETRRERGDEKERRKKRRWNRMKRRIGRGEQKLRKRIREDGVTGEGGMIRRWRHRSKRRNLEDWGRRWRRQEERNEGWRKRRKS